MFYLSLAIIIGFMIVHIFTNYIKFLDRKPKDRLMSFVSGGSIAYVFLHLVPELTHYQEVAEDAQLPAWLENLDYVTYMATLVGIVFFYGINQLNEKSQEKNEQEQNISRPSKSVFALEIFGFALYNVLIGYLLIDLSGENIADYIIYFIVFSFHFIANNRMLHLTHEDLYTNVGRWALAFSVLAGWLIYNSTETNELNIAFFSAFLTGGIVLNILNDELPAEKNSSFPSFIAGLIFIAVLLQLIL
ncbi:hypothetical protein A1A1_08184 [Planococcus antarcticus DSM 14505]|uniref:ZIP Zinc transporter n=1 Tax=Planococcus antarcticus DSM 14505 TaxID=1185653 RepID=A0A1C7DKN1_9BACL|nr:hypothetical protein [Planococcus antarcticus]ANU11831.1 hypothetical protein BBH88_17025 [Planococcus antarcticus DSM 14505]EIM06931.1 hypothetical protein A1A1_08184 [Planococcus antarcticus DSM 14505]